MLHRDPRRMPEVAHCRIGPKSMMRLNHCGWARLAAGPEKCERHGGKEGKKPGLERHFRPPVLRYQNLAEGETVGGVYSVRKAVPESHADQKAGFERFLTGGIR
jgi:hypothetical protein